MCCVLSGSFSSVSCSFRLRYSSVYGTVCWLVLTKLYSDQRSYCVQYVLDLDLEFVIWNWGLILLILGLMRWCAGIIFDFHFWVPRVMSCGGELRRIFYYFCFTYILDSQFPRFFELIIWIRIVFELWRDYFRGWILDMIFVFGFPDPRSSVFVS